MLQKDPFHQSVNSAFKTVRDHSGEKVRPPVLNTNFRNNQHVQQKLENSRERSANQTPSKELGLKPFNFEIMTPADTEPHPLLQKQKTSFATSNYTHATAQFQALKYTASESANATVESLIQRNTSSTQQHLGPNILDRTNLFGCSLQMQQQGATDDAEKTCQFLNLKKQATSHMLSLKRRTISEAQSYNFSLNRAALQSQGITQTLIKQQSMNLNFDKQSHKSSVQTGQFNNNNQTNTIRASSKTSKRSFRLGLGFERVQRQIEKDVRQRTSNNNQLEETIKSTSLFQRYNRSPSKDISQALFQNNNKQSTNNVIQPLVLKGFRDKSNETDLEQIDMIQDDQKGPAVCPSSGPGYFDQIKVNLAPRSVLLKDNNNNTNKQNNKNNKNKSSSESIFNDKEQIQINRSIIHKAEIDKINKQISKADSESQPPLSVLKQNSSPQPINDTVVSLAQLSYQLNKNESLFKQVEQQHNDNNNQGNYRADFGALSGANFGALNGNNNNKDNSGPSSQQKAFKLLKAKRPPAQYIQNDQQKPFKDQQSSKEFFESFKNKRDEKMFQKQSIKSQNLTSKMNMNGSSSIIDDQTQTNRKEVGDNCMDVSNNNHEMNQIDINEANKKSRGAGKNKELRETLLKEFFDEYMPRTKGVDSKTRCNNCKSCLDGYCQCFKDGFFCDGKCGCQTCENQIQFIVRIRQEKIAKEKRKLKGKKINKIEDFHKYVTQFNIQDQIVCNCKKNCDLKYCKCRQANKSCTHECNCQDCHNQLSGQDESN